LFGALPVATEEVPDVLANEGCSIRNPQILINSQKRRVQLDASVIQHEFVILPPGDFDTHIGQRAAVTVK
jgi:hypothetical protein